MAPASSCSSPPPALWTRTISSSRPDGVAPHLRRGSAAWGYSVSPCRRPQGIETKGGATTGRLPMTETRMDRNLALEAVRVTEAAALAASKLMGRGDEKKADQAAVDAMRTTLNSLAIEGTVVIGEGERDEAPM